MSTTERRVIRAAARLASAMAYPTAAAEYSEPSTVTR